MTNGNGQWFKATVFLAGLIVGGGGAGAVGHYQYQGLEQKLEEEIEDTHDRIDVYHDLVTQLLVEVGKLHEKMDHLADEVNRIRDRQENPR